MIMLKASVPVYTNIPVYCIAEICRYIPEMRYTGISALKWYTRVYREAVYFQLIVLHVLCAAPDSRLCRVEW
jgi:hypothetical protein